MALVNSAFAVNVTPGAMPPTVHVSEYDIGRTYTVTINGQNGSAFNIPTGTTATVEGTLNGTIGFTTGATISGSNVSFTLTESMTAYSGTAWCKIKLSLNDEPIQTCAFVLAVDRAGVEAETVIGAPGFEEQIQTAVDNYLEEHPVGVEVDPTLTISGAAADAKVTGDKFSDLKSALGNVNGSQIKTKQIDYSKATITEGKKITGYDTQTFIPTLGNELGACVLDVAIADLANYSQIKFPRCTKSSQWFIIYGSSAAWNFVKTSHSTSAAGNYDLSNDGYGIINCKWLSTTSYSRVIFAFDDVADVYVDSQFESFFSLMDAAKKNESAYKDIRGLYYSGTINITVQSTSTYVPFTIANGETLKFTNNTTGNVSLYAVDSSNNRTLITSSVSAGQSVSFTATADFVQILYWAQQTGTLRVIRTDAIIYQLTKRFETEEIASVNMFTSIAAIGDSYTAGSTKNSNGTWQDYRNLSWIATMGKRSGTNWKNYGHGGATTKTYLETTEFTSALSDTSCDLYFFALGQNDGNQEMTIGTVADIHDSDYTQNPDTFYGNYGRIIQQIKTHAPNAKLVMIKNWVQGATWTDYDTAIEGIATHYGIPCIAPFDDYFFNSALYQDYKEYGHPTAMGYSSMGIAMERLFSKCVVNNPSYFKFATVG